MPAANTGEEPLDGHHTSLGVPRGGVEASFIDDSLFSSLGPGLA